MNNNKRQKTDVHSLQQTQWKPQPKYELNYSTPQDLCFSIISSPQQVYSKNELLEIISKLATNQQMDPLGPLGPCSYIN